ncbi:hypothetical protein J8L98_13430 [Pseudoalteromonas sp. MMG013]|uniref:Uncharacterized protein n=1 Tax=Pseudoalteromonas aurantia 208 TaxID=1314867 RepID=A0ABR9E8B2_9GAMM|nr:MULTISPECIES: hypothetical protein [Pseudoalteromonas]MBE0366470.1 hypothetical protein [Pseudoalteromonas aurantia 208]MBQ4846586.1 hypothetical protein [Pseudoalteromonas sp. MMG005]MBQ4850711.1 hypothetical protein [Pseudoalteromonas sp. MMG012]MBQ4862692.1 hypothetical protein [Pseudoalteromonas sp. MMG013]
MKLVLKKKNMKDLKHNAKTLPAELTPNVAGAGDYTLPVWKCMSYLGCISNNPRFGC